MDFCFKTLGEIRTNVLTTWWPHGGSISFKLSFKFKLCFKVSLKKRFLIIFFMVKTFGQISIVTILTT
jgi:hypothetical protein